MDILNGFLKIKPGYYMDIFADYFPNATLTKGEYRKCRYIQYLIK